MKLDQNGAFNDAPFCCFFPVDRVFMSSHPFGLCRPLYVESEHPSRIFKHFLLVKLFGNHDHV